MKKNIAFYLCQELDCAFHFKYNYLSIKRPVLSLDILVVALNKKVKIELAGFGDAGLNICEEHGHDHTYIFPVDLFKKPHTIDPILKYDKAQNWERLIAHKKGENFVSQRKRYMMLDWRGEKIKDLSCNPEEFAFLTEKEVRRRELHPREKLFHWQLYEILEVSAV